MKWWKVSWPWAIILGLTFAAFWTAAKFLEVLASLDKLILAALIAVGGAVVTAITALIVKKLERKHEVDAQFRQDKVELFDSLLVEFDEISESSDPDPQRTVDFLKHFQRKVVFWAGPKVMKSYFALRRGLSGDIKTIGDLGGSLQLVGALILAMRKDIGLSNFGLDPRTFAAHWKLRHSDLFLAKLKEDPSMTTTELDAIEKELDRRLGLSE